MEARTTILQDRLERARRRKTRGWKRDRRRAAELVCLETEGARRRCQDGNSVDDPRPNLRRLCPETQVDVSRGRHRIAENQERHRTVCSRGQEDLAVLHLLPAQPANLAVDQLLYGFDRSA